MRKRRFYGSVLIKKRRYWTKSVNGDGINEIYLDRKEGGGGLVNLIA